MAPIYNAPEGATKMSSLILRLYGTRRKMFFDKIKVIAVALCLAILVGIPIAGQLFRCLQ